MGKERNKIPRGLVSKSKPVIEYPKVIMGKAGLDGLRNVLDDLMKSDEAKQIVYLTNEINK